MAVERQMASRPAAVEAADDVRHRRLRVDDLVRDLLGIEQTAYVGRGIARVARRVRAFGAHETGEKFDQSVAVALIGYLGPRNAVRSRPNC